jgi:hypothetical protein
VERTELRKTNGDVFLEVERMPDNAYILAQWIGLQTLETVKQGGIFYTQMIKQHPCPKLLNSHEELIGPWNVANDWIVEEWTPRVQALGLRYMAQVLAPGVYGQMSFHQLHQRISNKWEIKMFDKVAAAREWLLSLP